MRSIRRLAVVTGALVLASACGDGGGTEPPPNVAPVANFTAPSCTVNAPCTFTSTSTDDVGITAYGWDFTGDGTPEYTTASAVHTFLTAGSFSVVLTVTDAGGLTGTKSNPVTVTAAPPVNAAPVANFTPPSCTVGVACNFIDASTDDVAVTGWSWDLNGDGTADATTKDATFTYTTAGTFSVKLTVTDGGTPPLTDDVTQTVTVSPPAAAQCTTNGGLVDCVLSITARSTVKITLTGVSCDLTAQRVITPTTQPVQTIFGNICNRSAGEEHIIHDGTPAGTARVFEAGSQVTIRFDQGDPDPLDPPLGFPAARQTGTFPNWTLSIDDGGNPSGTGEPDFDDVVLGIQASPAP